MILTVPVCALGNRLWGDSSMGYETHWLGAVLMAYGITISHPAQWFLFPVFVAVMYLYRGASIAPELDMTKPGGSWLDGSLRAILFIPIPLLMYWLDRREYHLCETALFVLIPVIYWLAGRQTRVECVALAECLTGALIGACAL
jgi:hypothetical protein